MTYYLNAHSSQYAPSALPVTRHAGCTWTSGANGIDASTGGRQKPTPDQLHAKLNPGAETNPRTPGWSLPDLATALHTLGVPFSVRSGEGWDAAMTALREGHYLVVQGVSAEFANATCSGAFEGDHAIGVHPRTTADAQGRRSHWINDPICPAGRWERDDVLHAYARALSAGILFGTFDHPVPVVPPAWRWTRRPRPPRTSVRFSVYEVWHGEVTGRPRIETSGGTSQPCTAPRAIPYPGHGTRRLVQLLSGPRKGEWVHAMWAKEV